MPSNWENLDEPLRESVQHNVELYERVSSESPSFELLFERLFLPYTE